MEIEETTMTSYIVSKVPGLFDPQQVFIEALLSERCVRRVPLTEAELEVSQHVALDLHSDVDVPALYIRLHNDIAVVHAPLVMVLRSIRRVATHAAGAIVSLPLPLKESNTYFGFIFFHSSQFGTVMV